MGSWGPGIFDNDAARDHLFEVTRELAEQIEQALAEGAALKLTGKDTLDDLATTIETVLPNVEIMCVLHESLGGGFLPELKSATEWQSQFEVLDVNPSVEHQTIVRATFERLRRLSQQCWEE